MQYEGNWYKSLLTNNTPQHRLKVRDMVRLNGL